MTFLKSEEDEAFGAGGRRWKIFESRIIGKDCLVVLIQRYIYTNAMQYSPRISPPSSRRIQSVVDTTVCLREFHF